MQLLFATIKKKIIQHCTTAAAEFAMHVAQQRYICKVRILGRRPNDSHLIVNHVPCICFYSALFYFRCTIRGCNKTTYTCIVGEEEAKEETPVIINLFFARYKYNEHDSVRIGKK